MLKQFTTVPNVVPNGSDLTQAVIDRSHRGRQRNSKLPLKTDQPRNSSASRRYEVEFDVGQSRVEELAVASHLHRGSTANDLMCATLAPTDAASSLRACRQSAAVRRKQRSQAC